MGTTEVQMGKGRNGRLHRYNSHEVCAGSWAAEWVSGLTGENVRSGHHILLTRKPGSQPAEKTCSTCSGFVKTRAHLRP